MEHRISILFYVRKNQNEPGRPHSGIYPNYHQWPTIGA